MYMLCHRVLHRLGFLVPEYIFYVYIYIWGGFLKWWLSPTNPWGFPTKNDQHLGCFAWGETHHLRKRPYIVGNSIITTSGLANSYVCSLGFRGNMEVQPRDNMVVAPTNKLATFGPLDLGPTQTDIGC